MRGQRLNHLTWAAYSKGGVASNGFLIPRTEIGLRMAWIICHCEHPKGAWQSKSSTVRLLRFTRNDDFYLCFWADGGSVRVCNLTRYVLRFSRGDPEVQAQGLGALLPPWNDRRHPSQACPKTTPDPRSIERREGAPRHGPAGTGPPPSRSPSQVPMSSMSIMRIITEVSP